MEKQETVSIKKYIIGFFKPWLFQVQGYAASEILGCDAQFGFNRCRRYMGRRNKDKELVEILLVLPWWLNIGLGIAGYFGLRWFFPSMLPPLLKGMVPAIQSIAWIPLLLFSFFGLLFFSCARTSTRVSSAAHTRLSRTTERPTEILVGRPAGKLAMRWETMLWCWRNLGMVHKRWHLQRQTRFNYWTAQSSSGRFATSPKMRSRACCALPSQETTPHPPAHHAESR